MRTPQRWRKMQQESGSSILEMALVLPVFLLLSFGFIDFCMVVFGMANMNYSSRAALRYASLHSLTSYSPTTQSDLDRIVNSYLFAYPSSTHQVSASYSNGNIIGSAVNVNIQVVYSFTVMGRTYSGIALNTNAYGTVMQ